MPKYEIGPKVMGVAVLAIAAVAVIALVALGAKDVALYVIDAAVGMEGAP